jgi:hypothetical protein
MGWGFYIRNVERRVELEVVDNCKGHENRQRVLIG